MPWPDNGVDHLEHAVVLLATGTGTLQQRLDQAWLVLQSLDDRCFRRVADTAAWDRIKAAVATSRLVPMSDHQAQAVARMVVDLHAAVRPTRETASPST